MSARWWICPDDPEAGYIDADDEEVSVVWVKAAHCHVAINCDGEVVAVDVERAKCQLCDRSVLADSSVPLCERCQRTAKAHARLEREAAVQREEGGL